MGSKDTLLGLQLLGCNCSHPLLPIVYVLYDDLAQICCVFIATFNSKPEENKA
jgi:hypothetical protein